MQLAENITLGLDLGIGSIGWILLVDKPDGGKSIVTRITKKGEVIYGIGVRLVDVPENAKDKQLLNVHRREKRGQRRVIKRRAQRMKKIRALLFEHNLIEAGHIDSLPSGENEHLNPWLLRAEGLHRQLTDCELSAVLLHMAKHRGFKSNSKKDRSGEDKETGKMLAGISQLEAKLKEEGCATVGEYLAKQPRKRNRAGIDGKPEYTHTVRREMLEEETRLLFNLQRNMGNKNATKDLEEQYITEAFSQRPLRSVSDMVGWCSFVEGERRAPAFSPTAEKFRLAQKLTVLRLHDHPASGGNGERRSLTVEEINKILELIGSQKGITFAAVRKTLKLSPSIRFEGLSYGQTNKDGKAKNPETIDIARKTGDACPGSYIFGKVLGENSFARLNKVPAESSFNTEQLEKNKLCLPRGACPLDVIAKIVSDSDDLEEITEQIQALHLELGLLSAAECEALVQAVAEGKFSSFKGTMHLSLLAMQNILPYMIEHRDYRMGCACAGFDHTKALAVDIGTIRNHLVAHMLAEIDRQVYTIMHEFGVIPGAVHVEMARDIGKGADERKKLERAIAERTDEKKGNREKLAVLLNRSPSSITATELLRYELWLVQKEKCGYYMLWRKAGGEHAYGASSSCCAGSISIEDLQDDRNIVQIDHILPYSRSSDNSFNNLCLCCVAANQAKGNRTPYEWVGKQNSAAWHEFEQWVETTFAKGLRRRNLLMQNMDEEVQARFVSRNLNDTRYICRLVLQLLQNRYSELGVAESIDHERKAKRRFFARPGQVTAFLRRLWGLEGIKKDKSGKRKEDGKHHALDAFVIACCSEKALQDVTAYFQAKETGREPKDVFAPMRHSRRDLQDVLDALLVSRAETMRKGALHEETLRSIREELNEKGKPVRMLYKRVPVNNLTEANLAKIKDPHRCPELLNVLEKWIEAGKPSATPPRLSSGNVVRRVILAEEEFKSGIIVQRGCGQAQASNGEMPITRVYRKNNKFYLVPVYTWQLAQGIEPNRAIVCYKDEKDWLLVDDSFEFCFSLQKNSFVRVVKKNGETWEGYFRGTDRSGAKITILLPTGEEKGSLGVQGLVTFEKYRVDRLGRRHLVRREKRPL